MTVERALMPKVASFVRRFLGSLDSRAGFWVGWFPTGCGARGQWVAVALK